MSVSVKEYTIRKSRMIFTRTFWIFVDLPVSGCDANNSVASIKSLFNFKLYKFDLFFLFQYKKFPFCQAVHLMSGLFV